MNKWIRTFVPRRMQRALKKAYYPWFLKRFDDMRWPYSQVVRQWVQPGHAVIDAGANIGYLTKLFSEWVGDEGQVFSVEPIPETRSYLEHNVRRLNLKNITVIAKALSSRIGTEVMAIPEYFDGGTNYYESRIVDESESDDGMSCVDVETSTVDLLLPQIEQPLTFIKVDVEGHELELLRGAEECLHRYKPALLVEIEGDMALAASNAAQVYQLLVKHHYQAYVLKENELIPWEPGYHAVDYLFLQNNHVGDVRCA